MLAEFAPLQVRRTVFIPPTLRLAALSVIGDGSPPFVVRRIMPLSPTAMPVKPSVTTETSLRFVDVPLVCSFHVTPESFVRRILPDQPTANPMFDAFVTGKSTPSSP